MDTALKFGAVMWQHIQINMRQRKPFHELELCSALFWSRSGFAWIQSLWKHRLKAGFRTLKTSYSSVLCRGISGCHKGKTNTHTQYQLEGKSNTQTWTMDKHVTLPVMSTIRRTQTTTKHCGTKQAWQHTDRRAQTFFDKTISSCNDIHRKISTVELGIKYAFRCCLHNWRERTGRTLTPCSYNTDRELNHIKVLFF